ncbi:hypothetical protein HMPREF9371_0907 [Neisseria shayeganii 871]|uniref:Uncharacterized protein n=1 Tax=Neisseria shayeganii 871 TaxID=1032488 RepID=G4CH18_9NEIS|nr:hypothetical protein HMPREF9371_0907 [Neisseria shayeganii 871]
MRPAAGQTARLLYFQINSPQAPGYLKSFSGSLFPLEAAV